MMGWSAQIKGLARSAVAVAFLAMGGLLIAPSSVAQDAGPIVAESGDEAELTGALDEMAFVAGGRIVVSATSTDDIYAAGGNVIARTASAADLIVAGGDILLDGAEADDVRAAGGTLKFLDGNVRDDVVVFGGQIQLGPEFSVAGSAVLAGGEVRLESPVGGEVRAGGGYVLIDSVIGRDVSVAGDRVVIGPNARIGGSLTHRAGQIEIDPAAVVSGEIRALEPEENAPLRAQDVIWMVALAFVGGLVALILLAWAAAIFLPGLMRDADEMIREKPWVTLAVGFLIGLVAPGLLLLLVVTIVGIPVALTLGALLVAAIPLAIAAFVNFAGMMIRRLLKHDVSVTPDLPTRALWSAAAVIALVLVGLIPFVGAIAWTAAYVTGLGAVTTQGAKSLARGVRPAAA